MKKTGLILILLLAVMPLHAQQARSGIKGLSFVSPLRISVANDSNFLIDRSQPDERLFYLSLPPTVQPFAPNGLPKQYDDQVLLINLPTVGFISDSLRRQFAVTYQPEFEVFRSNSDQNATNHIATADLRYQLTRRTAFTVSDAFQNSSDPSRTLQNVFLVLPRGSYRQNQFRAAASYNHSELTTFGARFDHTITLYGQVDQFQRRVMDATTTGVSAYVSRMVKRNHRLRLTLTRIKPTPIDEQGIGDDEVDHADQGDYWNPAHSINVEYRFSPNASTVVETSFGLVNRTGSTNYVFSLAGDRRIGNTWFGGGYSRALSYFAGDNTYFSNGITPAAYFETLYLRFRGEPKRNFGVEITGIGSRSVNSRVVEDSLSGLARLRLDHRLTDRTVAFVNFETYQQNRNQWVAAPVSRNRFVLGIEFSLAGEVSRRTSRLNRDADRVALTERGRRQIQPR